MPIQTATPEQVEQCILGLKRTVDRQAATIERLTRQLQDARAWAALWKRAAKWHRHGNMIRIDVVLLNTELKAENQRQAAEIERLRGALGEIEPLRMALLNIRDTVESCYVAGGWVPLDTEEMAALSDIANDALDADHDAR